MCRRIRTTQGDRHTARPHTAAVVAVALIILVAARSAPAQDEGPVVFTRRQELKPFVVTDLKATLNLLFQHHIDQIDRQGQGGKTTDTQTLLRQSIDLSAQAAILHPNFIDLSLAGAFSMEEQFLDSESDNIKDTVIQAINEFDLSATLLRRSNAPLTLYGQRAQTTIDRQFAGSLDNIITTYGGRLNLRLENSSHVFNVMRREQVQTDIGGDQDFQSAENSIQWQSQLNLGDNQRMDFEYLFNQVQESGTNRPNRLFVRHEANVTHELKFGEDQEHQLESNFSLFKNTGDFKNQRIRMLERLNLHHSDTFKTQYEYALNQIKDEGFNQTEHRGRARLRHRLYDSLLTTGSAGAATLKSSDGFGSDERFADLFLDYTKQVPMGVLNLTANLRGNVQDNDARGDTTQVVGELHTFVDPAPVVLTRRNILVASIIVRRVPDLTTFIEGIDYTVRAFFDRVELRRVIGGTIVSGQMVSIDYRIGPEAANTIVSRSTGLTIRYDLKEGPLRGLGLYTVFIDAGQEIDSDDPAIIANDLKEIILGVDYRIGPFYFKAEQRDHDSTLSPFEALHLEGRYTQRRGPGSTLGVQVQYDELDFTLDDNTTKLLVVTGRARQHLTPKLSAQLELLWRQETQDIGSDSTGFEQDLRFEWTHRQTKVFFRLRNALLESDSSNSMFQRLELGISREF